jgi:putative FmdB family regulatory protein
MPVYEYECTKCGRVEEAFQRFSDKPLSKCRQCSGRLHKLISQSAFHLKGSGWYVTDYTNKSKTSASKSQKAESATSDSGTSSAGSGTPKDSA